MSAMFSVGDKVTYWGKYNGRPLRCTVIRVMPVEHDVRSYHIRDSDEGFERAVPESSLTRVGESPIDRVFES